MMKEPDAHASLTTSIRRQHRWRMVVAGLVILAAGMTLGVAGTMLVVRPGVPRPPMAPERAAGFMLMHFEEELELTPEQVDQIKAILNTRMTKLDEIREKARPEIEAQLDLMKSEISEVLTPEQEDHWQGIIERLERMFKRGMRRGPGGRGGPGGPGDRRGPGERFGDRRGPFPGPGRPDPNDPNGPRDWRRDGRRSGGGRYPWRRRPDANEPPPPPQPFQDDAATSDRPEPNIP
jgi:Spy/CpxP family protein refolding chaperone